MKLSLRQGIKKRAIGYTRVSTEAQVIGGQSLEAQQQKIMDYCKYKELELIQCYVEPGMSGTNTNRPEFQKMISELTPGITVIVVSISRLSRNVLDIINTLKTIKEKCCEIAILDIDMDTSTAAGGMVLGMMSVLAEFESKQTSERVSATMINMSREGKLITKPKYGYKVVKDGDISTVVKDDAEQEVIHMIGDLIKQDKRITTSEICRILNQQGVKLRKAKKIYSGAVDKIIRELIIDP